MAIKIVFTNQKGGVGKTTTTGALAVGLSKKGYKVLAIDMDPQGNLAFSLGAEMDEGYTLYDVMKKDVHIKDAIQEIDDCHIVSSNILLSEAEIVFQGEGRELLLKSQLEEIENEYDFIVIDTPPALNILTLNGYAAADHLIIPMASEILSLVGLVQLRDTIGAIRKTINPELNVLGILLTKFNKRTNLAKDVLDMATSIAEDEHSVVFDTKIRTGIAVAEAPAHGKCVITYSPSSNPAKDYMAFTDEVCRRILQYHMNMLQGGRNGEE